MRGNRQTLLSLIEQQPRRVRELVVLTNARLATIYDALRELKSCGAVVSRKLPNGRGGVHVYCTPSTNMDAFA